MTVTEANREGTDWEYKTETQHHDGEKSEWVQGFLFKAILNTVSSPLEMSYLSCFL